MFGPISHLSKFFFFNFIFHTVGGGGVKNVRKIKWKQNPKRHNIYSFTSFSEPKMNVFLMQFCLFRWLKGPDDIQATDVHYRSLTGEGNFNWR